MFIRQKERNKKNLTTCLVKLTVQLKNNGDNFCESPSSREITRGKPLFHNLTDCVGSDERKGGSVWVSSVLGLQYFFFFVVSSDEPGLEFFLK